MLGHVARFDTLPCRGWGMALSRMGAAAVQVARLSRGPSSWHRRSTAWHQAFSMFRPVSPDKEHTMGALPAFRHQAIGKGPRICFAPRPGILPHKDPIFEILRRCPGLRQGRSAICRFCFSSLRGVHDMR